MENISLYNLSRVFWTDHIVYTRLYIISAVSSLDNDEKEANLQRLLSNQDDIGSLFEAYGKEVQDAVAKLLKVHIEIAGRIVVAAKSKKDTDLLIEEWRSNANDIAVALSKLKGECECCDQCSHDSCPECECCDQCHGGLEAQFKTMLNMHLDILLDESISYIEGNYKLSIEHFDTAIVQGLEMSDTIYYALLE